MLHWLSQAIPGGASACSLFFCAAGAAMADASQLGLAPVEDFDPYFKWLGIPSNEQPPTHYRLLAIPDFTADLEVIENAADQRLAHLRAVQTGKRAAHAQHLLNEVTAAKICLLDPAQRAAYDKQLRDRTGCPSLPPTILSDPPALQSWSKTPAKGGVAKHILVSLGGILLVLLLLNAIQPGHLFLRFFAPPSTANETAPSPSTAAPLSPVLVSGKGTEQRKRQLAPETRIVVPRSEHSGPSIAPNVVEPEKGNQQRQRLKQEQMAAIQTGDLLSALPIVHELALVDAADPLKAKITFLATLDASPSLSTATIAPELANLLEQAVAEGRRELAAQYADHLLSLARDLNDPRLERRATLIVLETRQ